MKIINRVYAWFLRGVNSCQSVFLLAVRLYWGWQFWQAGWGKARNIPKVVDYFTSLGIPAPALNAYFISWLEVAGAILLILGLGARLIAFPLAIDMIVAYVVGDREALGSIFSDPDKFYAAAPYTFLMASFIILFFGPGWFSLDTAIDWYRKKRHSSATAPQS
jgi:putative oxidoreductase